MNHKIIRLITVYFVTVPALRNTRISPSNSEIYDYSSQLTLAAEWSNAKTTDTMHLHEETKQKPLILSSRCQNLISCPK